MNKKTQFLLLAPFLAFALFPNSVRADAWHQDGHDAQRTAYTSDEPAEPWTLAWTWNGPDANGGSGAHFYNADRDGRIIVGGNFVFAPAANRGLYAIQKANGTQAWNQTIATFNATPAYDSSGFVYTAGTNGNLYKLDANTGSVIATYSAGNAINKSVLLVGNFVYVLTDNGQLHKVDKNTLTRSWMYSANANSVTLPSYSVSRDTIIFATQDLNVHAVNNGNGTVKWKVKPTPNSATWYNDMDGRWPVIAEQHGIVFIRMSLKYSDSLWGTPTNRNDSLFGVNGKPGVFPGTNAEIRGWLQRNPEMKNLFALNLDNGTESFVPAVGYTGVEDLYNFSTGQRTPTGEAYLEIGPMPVVKILPDGKEVAYIGFRNGQNIKAGDWQDGRWDGHMGEMVLDNTTISGMVAGDMRFVAKPDLTLIDEQLPLTIAGNTIFHAHWGANQSSKITDRNSSLGLNYASPIKTQDLPPVVRRVQPCGTINATTHWTTCGMTLFSDTRYYGGPGFWVYWNTMDPPIPQTTAYQTGLRPFYTLVSSGYIFVEGAGGDITALRHSGGNSPSSTPSLTSATTCKGDVNGDSVVDLSDYSLLVQNFLKSPLTNPKADFNGDGVVDLSDYSVLVSRFLKPCSP